MDIKAILEEHTSALANGDGLRINRNSKEAEVEILPPKVDPKPPPTRLRSHSLPILHTVTSQHPVITEHSTPSGLVVPDSTILPAPALQRPVEALPISVSGSSPIEILKKRAVFMQYRPREKWRDEQENRIMVFDTAEVLLSALAIQGGQELQKYFANGRGANVTMEINNFGIWERFSINSGRLWNIRFVDASILAVRWVDNHGNTYFSKELDLKRVVPSLQNCPLLCIATAYNNPNDVFLEEHCCEMAMRICEDFSIDPAEYPSKSSLPLGEKMIQYSALSNQNTVEGGVPFRGKGGGTRYYLQKRPVNGGVSSQANACVYVLVSPLVAQGCPLTRMSYVPPEKPLFYRQDEILRNDGRPIFMTSQLDFAFEAVSCADCIVTTAWRLEDCLDDDLEATLPWVIFRGQTVIYILISDSKHQEQEFDVAMRVCRKIKSAGSGHPQIAVVLDGDVWDELYTEETFCNLARKLTIDNADMVGFPDLQEREEVFGGPTAVPFINEKELMIVLGEPKVGKTWYSIYLSYMLAVKGTEPGLVIYCYGEGDPYYIQKQLDIVRMAMEDGNASQKAFTPQGKVLLLNINDRDWGTEGFDLKKTEHQQHLHERIKAAWKENPSLKPVGVILDNYASIMGKNQEAEAAIPLLSFCKDFQRQGMVMVLACHTNQKGDIAGSAYLLRRTNGVIRLSKVAPWQKDIMAKLDTAAEKSKQQSPIDDCLAKLENEFDEEERSRTKIKLHVSFEAFRSQASPQPLEIEIDTQMRSITENTVTKDVKMQFAHKYADWKKTPEDGARKLLAHPKEDAQSKMSPDTVSFDEIKKMSPMDQIEALKKIVNDCGCESRTALALVLGIKSDDLDNFMKNRIHNEQIGLSSSRGRPKKG